MREKDYINEEPKNGTGKCVSLTQVTITETLSLQNTKLVKYLPQRKKRRKRTKKKKNRKK